MKRNLTFIVILLTILSIVNAISVPLNKRAILHKRATNFTECPSGSPTFDSISVSPDPIVAGEPVTFSFSINSPPNITGGTIITNLTSPDGTPLGSFPLTLDLCTVIGVNCPIDLGSGLSVSYSAKIPPNAPKTYDVTISLTDQTGAVLDCSTGTGNITNGPNGPPGPLPKGPNVPTQPRPGATHNGTPGIGGPIAPTPGGPIPAGPGPVIVPTLSV